MTDVQKALWELENSDFIFSLNLASDLRTFLRIAIQQETVNDLLGCPHESRICELLLQRLISLTNRRSDPRYENPADTSIAILLWLLSKGDKELAKIGAGAIFESYNCWWARKIADEIYFHDLTENTFAASVSPFKTTPSKDHIPEANDAADLTVSANLTPFLFYMGRNQEEEYKEPELKILRSTFSIDQDFQTFIAWPPLSEHGLMALDRSVSSAETIELRIAS